MSLAAVAMARTSRDVSGPSSISSTCGRCDQGGSNSGRNVSTHRTGRFARLLAIRPSSSTVVGSAQCTSSTTSSSG